MRLAVFRVIPFSCGQRKFCGVGRGGPISNEEEPQVKSSFRFTKGPEWS